MSTTCKANSLLLLLDGARLGTALSADINDLTLKDITELTDVFWIGGTKAGALIGEAIIIPNQQLADDFSFHIKQRGTLLAKGHLLGLRFAELFKNILFFENTKHSIVMAQKLSEAIIDRKYKMAANTESNQIFPILLNALIEQLKQKFTFYVWQKHDDAHSVVRLVTSWATDETKVDDFIAAL